MNGFLVALSFLTIVPAPRSLALPGPDRIGWTLAWYPLVGAALGLALGGAGLILFGILPPLPAGALLTILWALATGGLHLDGVADSCDAVFSSRSRARALEIMKDPHIGVMGVIGVVSVLGAKAALLAEIGPRVLPILAACFLGRWAMAVACATSRYARPEGGMASGIIQPDPARAALASAWLLVAAPYIPYGSFGRSIAAAALVVFLLRAVFLRRLGGLTGDCAGAIGEACEVVVLAGYLARWPVSL